MRKKILISLIALLIIFFAALFFLPYLFRDKIESFAKEEINKQVDATIDWGGFGISILNDFPDITISLRHFCIINKAPFEGDTLAYLGSLDLTIDIMTAIKRNMYDIKAIYLNNPKIRASKNSEGGVNWNIVKDSGKEDKKEQETALAYNIKLRTFKINNGDILYRDDSSYTIIQLDNLHVSALGDFSQDKFLLRSTTSIEALTFKSGAAVYLNQARLELKANIDVNQATHTYLIKENELRINALTLGLDGFLKINQDNSYEMDVTLQTRETAFKTLLSLIPAIYKKDFNQLTADGTLSLVASAKGTYKGDQYPAFQLRLDVNNGRFKYPSLPVGVQNVFVNLNITNPGGQLDNTVIDLSRLSAQIDNDPFLFRITIRNPISDPHINAMMKGRLNLSKVPAYYPSEEIKKISGLLNIDVEARGRLSAIENERYQDFYAKGNADLSAFTYESTQLPAPVSISSMQLQFSPQQVSVSNMNMKFGRSDFRANGSLDNLLNYLFLGETLKGTLTVNSNNIDLNEFMTESSTSAEEKEITSDSVIQIRVPENIDFTLNGHFRRILYDKIELKNISGTLAVRNQTVRISGLSADLFDGKVTINGMYATHQPGNPEIAFDYDMKNIRFQDAFKAFNLFRQYAPIMEKVNGRFSSRLNVKGRLSQDMTPDLKTLVGDGLLEMNAVTVNNIDVLDKIADKFKMNQIRNLSIDKAWTVFRFKDGRMVIDPTDLKLHDYVINLSGSHGLDNTLDYDILMDVPTRLLQGSINEVKNMIAQANIPGLSAVHLPEFLKLKVKVTGMMNDPKLNFSVAGIGSGTTMKDVAKELLDQKKKELEEKARAEAEKLKQQVQEEAERQKREMEERARAEQERLKKEAEKKAQEEKERMKKEAEKKIKDKFKFP